MDFLATLILGANISEELEIAEKTHKNEFYFPFESLNESKVEILMVAIVVSVIQLVLFLIVKHNSHNDSKKDEESSKRRRSEHIKRSYQLTNLLVNFFLGTYGIYFFIQKIPSVQDISTVEKIEGMRDVTFFANVQIGYQLWAIPVGLFLVNEMGLMIVHHFAVICVASISTFLTNGFRYYTPFFYGVIEISSVPLSLMNMFKNNPEWQKRYPTANHIIRLVFSLTFLTVRVYMWLPLIYDYLRHLGMVLWTSDNFTVTCIYTSMCVSAVLLTFLQLFWASLIVKGMVGVFTKPKKMVKHGKAN